MAERIADRASIPWDTPEMPEEDAERVDTRSIPLSLRVLMMLAYRSNGGRGPAPRLGAVCLRFAVTSSGEMQ